MRCLATIMTAMLAASNLVYAASDVDSAMPTDEAPNATNPGDTAIGTTFYFEQYYLPAEDLKGEELHKALNGIIREHKVLPFHDVFYALDQTDEDPKNSENVKLIYSGRSQGKDTKYWGGRSVYRWEIEHLWPASHGFPNEDQVAHSDLHNLRPADTTINKSRSNKDFDDGGYPHKEAANVFHDTDSFEPPKKVKGDIARSLFYMAVAYDGEMNETPDLRLSLNDTPNGKPKMGHLCTLLAWNSRDKPDAFEKARNDKVYKIQGNRNPFVDNPRYALDIWGEKCPAIGIWDSL